MSKPPIINCAGHTDPGKLRENNEDSMLLVPEQGVFMVADGMGGGAFGEIASRLACEAIEQAVENEHSQARPPTASERSWSLVQALNDVSARILEEATRMEVGSMGTTAVCLVLDSTNGRRAQLLHAGDSRAYRYRHWTLRQLTVDHSVAEAAGITNKKTMPRKYWSGVTRAIGTSKSVEVDRTPLKVHRGDLYILCSDGLTEMLSDDRIVKILRKHPLMQLEKLARILVAAANDAGGKDNVTVVLVKML